MATCTLACETQEAIIRYTTNGVDPTETDTVYSVPFTVDTGATVKAKAWKDGMIASAVASAEAPEPLTPTSVPLGSVLSDGSVVIYDRGSTYGDYNLTSGVLTRLSAGVDDESASSNNWRFLIADSADMAGNNGGTGDNKPWGPSELIEGISENGYGYGLANTNIILAQLGTYESYIWYTVQQRRTSDGMKWFVPCTQELAEIYDSADDSIITGISNADYYWVCDTGLAAYVNVSSNNNSNTRMSKSSTDCRVRLLRRY